MKDDQLAIIRGVLVLIKSTYNKDSLSSLFKFLDEELKSVDRKLASSEDIKGILSDRLRDSSKEIDSLRQELESYKSISDQITEVVMEAKQENT